MVFSLETGAVNNQIGMLQANEINNNNGFGISIANTSANVISNNNVSANTLGGVSVSNGAVSLTANSITANSGPGIYFSTANDNNISQNTISANTGDGILVNGANNTFFDNVVNGNSGLGLSVINGAGNQILENIIQTNTSGGISIINTSANLSGNIISENSAFGISLASANNTINDNEISANASHGLIINASSNDITNNTLFNNGVSGIGAGVYVQSGNDNSILYNSIYNNSELGIQLAPSANDSQPFPALSEAYSWEDETALTAVRGGSYIEGELAGETGVDYRVQFFANATSGTREGERYLAEIDVTPDIDGTADIIANLKDVIVYADERISSTATRLDNLDLPLSTSEFSPAIELNSDDGDHYKVNTTLAGIPLHWKEGKGDYQIAQSLVDIGYDDEVQAGFDTWSALQSVDLCA